MIDADADKLGRILDNPLGKTIDLSVPGMLLVQVSATMAAASVVTDGGPGIPEEQLATLFERFGGAPKDAHTRGEDTRVEQHRAPLALRRMPAVATRGLVRVRPQTGS